MKNNVAGEMKRDKRIQIKAQKYCSPKLFEFLIPSDSILILVFVYRQPYEYTGHNLGLYVVKMGLCTHYQTTPFQVLLRITFTTYLHAL